MFNADSNDGPSGPSPKEQVAIAVVIVALSAVANGLIGWGIQELRTKFGSKPPKEPDSP